MKIIIAAIHYPVASGRYIADAFRRLGHDVRTVGPCTGAEIWGMKVDERYIWKPTYELKDAELIAWGTWRPQMIITADSAYAIDGRGDCNCKSIVWGVDNHVRDYFPESKYDALFMAHSLGARMSEPNAHWLPCAYDPAWFHDDGLERTRDVAMLGVLYQERADILKKIYETGLDAWHGTGVVYNEYNLIYNRSKIALVKSFNGDLPIRFFENMAQGCCVLSDYLPDALKLGFEPYKDFWLYSGPEDAAQAAKWLIESGEWKNIAENGKAKVQGHTWDNRAKELLRVMEMSQ